MQRLEVSGAVDPYMGLRRQTVNSVTRFSARVLRSSFVSLFDPGRLIFVYSTQG